LEKNLLKVTSESNFSLNHITVLLKLFVATFHSVFSKF